MSPLFSIIAYAGRQNKRKQVEGHEFYVGQGLKAHEAKSPTLLMPGQKAADKRKPEVPKNPWCSRITFSVIRLVLEDTTSACSLSTQTFIPFFDYFGHQPASFLQKLRIRETCPVIWQGVFPAHLLYCGLSHPGCKRWPICRRRVI